MHRTGFSRLGQRTQAPPIAWLMETALGRPNLISLAAGFTDNSSLPVAETREILQEILADNEQARPFLQYGSNVGDPELRRMTIERLKEQDRPSPGVEDHYSSENVVITNGSQQFLYLLTEFMFDEGDLVLVEDPTYFVFLGIAQSHGVRCRGIRMETDGIEIEHLAAVLEGLKREGELERLKALYLVTYCQNPSGISTSVEKKKAALSVLRQYEHAAGHPIYLIEDGAYRELTFADQPKIPSALSIEGDRQRVLFTGTFSKPFSTGIRVGYGVLPEPVLTLFKRLKSNHDFGTSNLLQQILRQAFATGRYQAHAQELVQRYAKKANWMRSALEENFPQECVWPEPSGGLYYWARVPNTIKTGMGSEFFKTALKHDVLYVPGALCYAEDPTRPLPDHEMRLSFGNASQEQIHEGIKRLGDTIRSFL